MGYCSSIQLVKRLNALEREAHHFDQEGKVQHDITDLVKDKARMKIEAWIRLRWDIVDRWELVKLLNNDVLCKVGTWCAIVYCKPRVALMLTRS
jgi:hypothetical protein